uniref:hypothetical protein n=1 Tax=Escherichia coli TaxID=562 RepID=UPI001F180AF1
MIPHCKFHGLALLLGAAGGLPHPHELNRVNQVPARSGLFMHRPDQDKSIGLHGIGSQRHGLE